VVRQIAGVIRSTPELERGLDRLRVLAPFANYLVLTGSK